MEDVKKDSVAIRTHLQAGKLPTQQQGPGWQDPTQQVETTNHHFVDSVE